VALRMFEERQNLLAVMRERAGGKSLSFSQRMEDSQVHIDRIRAILRANGKDSLNTGNVIAASYAK
jgi:two-component system chemotaxis response regulator CheB